MITPFERHARIDSETVLDHLESIALSSVICNISSYDIYRHKH